MKLSRAAFLVLVALLLGACGYRENGESCWSDNACVSDNCSFGTCSPGLLELIASWFQDAPKPAPAPPPPAPQWPVPQAPTFPFCATMDRKECSATPRCRWVPLCLPDFTAQVPDAGVFACEREVRETGICPSGCRDSSACL